MSLMLARIIHERFNGGFASATGLLSRFKAPHCAAMSPVVLHSACTRLFLKQRE
jgi:hypothetical protein